MTAKRAGKRGPKPERLKLTGNSKKLVKKALPKERPTEGWPKSGEWLRFVEAVDVIRQQSAKKAAPKKKG